VQLGEQMSQPALDYSSAHPQKARLVSVLVLARDEQKLNLVASRGNAIATSRNKKSLSLRNLIVYPFAEYIIMPPDECSYSANQRFFHL
jgi:hypothetical protein